MSNLSHNIPVGTQESVKQIIRNNSRSIVPDLPDWDFDVSPIPPFSAVVFDVYGTMVCSGVGDISLTQESTGNKYFFDALRHSIGNAEEWIDCAHSKNFSPRKAFRDLILKEHEAGRIKGIEFPEVDILKIWENLLSRWGSDSLFQNLTNHDLAIVATHYEFAVNPVWLYKGVKETLKILHTNSIPMGIVSNSQFYTPLMLEVFLDNDLTSAGFDPRLCVWSYKEFVGKPDKKIYEIAAARLFEHYQIKPNDVLYIGNDMLKDVVASQSVGFKAALFAGDKQSLRLKENDPLCFNKNPDWVFNNWENAIEMA